MPHEFLSDFVARLQDAGDLVRIAAPVETGLELAAITDRVLKGSGPDGGPALLFEKPRDSSVPVVTNLLGSRKRLCLALGVESLDQIGDKLNRLLQPESGNWLEVLKLAPSTSGLAKFAPRVIKTAVCQQVVKLGRDVNLWDLPIPRCWPSEANPVITAGLTVTKGEAGSYSVSRFPIQVISQQQLAPHWHRHHAGYDQWQAAIREKRQFPIAMALGGDPTSLLATGLPSAFPDALLFGGFLRGTSVDLVKARSIDLEVPAASEIVLEGYIDYAGSLVDTPSVSCASGQYQPGEPLPVIQVTAVTHRANPLLPVIVPATPPSEESWISLALERLCLPIAKSMIPELVEIHQPFAGAGRNLLFVSIHKSHPLQARQVLNALWGSRLLGLNKMIVVVDADVKVQCDSAVWFAVGSHVNPATDLVSCDGPVSMDDQTTLHRGVGRKVGIDATRKFPQELHGRMSANSLAVSDEIQKRLQDRWSELGLPAGLTAAFNN